MTKRVAGRSTRGIAAIWALACATGTLSVAPASPGATLPFVDPGFENGGSPTMVDGGN